MYSSLTVAVTCTIILKIKNKILFLGIMRQIRIYYTLEFYKKCITTIIKYLQHNLLYLFVFR